MPKDITWRVHRVAVALRHEGKAPIEFGEFGKGYVHVFDKDACNAIMRELDTITDFVNYLIAKEALYEAGVATLFQGAEEDLLALYLHQGRVFPKGPDLLILDSGLWESIQRKPEYRRKKKEDVESYTWDSLIEWLLASYPAFADEPGPSFTEADLAVRTMARETRFSRRLLGKALKEFLIHAKDGRISSRIAPSQAGVTYVFLYIQPGVERHGIQAELGCRCLIARGMRRDFQTVIGIGIQEWASGQGSASCLVYLNMEDWSDKDEAMMRTMQSKLGYFSAPLTKRMIEDEYPVDPYALLRKVGRNAPCPCGSGRKYKTCHGR